MPASWLSKRIHPNFVVIDQRMRLLDLFRGHFFNDLLKTDRGIRIAANGGQRVPHIGADQIRRASALPERAAGQSASRASSNFPVSIKSRGARSEAEKASVFCAWFGSVSCLCDANSRGRTGSVDRQRFHRVRREAGGARATSLLR